MKTSLLFLICEITLNVPTPCLPFPSQTCRDILYSQTPQILDPVTNPPFGGLLGLPAYSPLH